MEPNETNAALNQTVSQMQGGVLRVGIASAIPVTAVGGGRWRRRASPSSRP